MEKLKALAKFMEVNTEEIEIDDIENVFTIGDKEYWVMTEEEANAAAKESILDAVWFFNPNFICAHNSKIDREYLEPAIKGLQENLYENSNDIILGFIDDIDHFVEDAISVDGRGHFLNTYDGAENEEEIDGTLYFIYRVN